VLVPSLATCLGESRTAAGGQEALDPIAARHITVCDILWLKLSLFDILAFVKTIAWTHEARRAPRKLPPNVRADIEAKIARFAETGAGNVKRLTGRLGARLRVRDWRVIFVETAEAVEVRAVGHRRDIYE